MDLIKRKSEPPAIPKSDPAFHVNEAMRAAAKTVLEKYAAHLAKTDGQFVSESHAEHLDIDRDQGFRAALVHLSMRMTEANPIFNLNNKLSVLDHMEREETYRACMKQFLNTMARELKMPCPSDTTLGRTV